MTASENGRLIRLPTAHAQVWMGPNQPFQTTPVPGVALASAEALVETELATICGSDIHTVRGHRVTPAPSVLGHEYVGHVAALGDGPVTDVEGRPLTVGDRVTWSVFAACGRCDRCRRGMPQKCRVVRKYGHERISPRWELNGGFATHVHLLPGTAIVRVPDRMPAAVAAPAACGTATAWAAVEAAAANAPLADATMIVSGAGLIGLTATAIAIEHGARVAVIDPVPERRALAGRFGAELTLAPDAPQAHVRALHERGWTEVAAVIEASGAQGAVAGALRLAGTGGVIVLAGSVSPAAPVPLDAEQLVRSCRTVRGLHNYPPSALAEAVRFLDERREYPFADLVGTTFGLTDLDAAFRAAAGPNAPIRVGVSPGADAA